MSTRQRCLHLRTQRSVHMERSCGPPSLQEMPATLAELWNRALMRRANTDSPSAASASNNGTDDAVDETQLQAEVAALLTEEGEGAVLSELLGEIPAGWAAPPRLPGSGPRPPHPPPPNFCTRQRTPRKRISGGCRPPRGTARCTLSTMMPNPSCEYWYATDGSGVVGEDRRSPDTHGST